MTQKRVWLLAVAVIFLALAAPAARGQDLMTKAADLAIDKADPDVVDPNLIKGEKWTLDFKYERLEPIIVTAPETNQREIYWYLVYTITNNTGAERTVVPTFTLFGKKGNLRRAGIYPSVYEAIKSSRKIPFLENAIQMVGKILTGPDSARTGVAIFAPLDKDMDKFTIFVEGLSGEYIERATPAGPPEKPVAGVVTPLAQTDKFIRLRKTMAITYNLPGDKWWLELTRPLFVSQKWTWR
jgi:hypothetical protein